MKVDIQATVTKQFPKDATEDSPDVKAWLQRFHDDDLNHTVQNGLATARVYDSLVVDESKIDNTKPINEQLAKLLDLAADAFSAKHGGIGLEDFELVFKK